MLWARALYRRPLREALDRLEPALSAHMTKHGVSTQLRVIDALTPFEAESLALVDEAVGVLDQIKEATLFNRYASSIRVVGCALFAAGRLTEAKSVFEQLIDEPADDAERATACWNLHQIFLHEQDLVGALETLKTAISLAPDWCAPFDVGRYELRELCGADDLGCVFRCHDKKTGEAVDIRVLWDADLDAISRLVPKLQKLAEDSDQAAAPPLDHGTANGWKRQPHVAYATQPGPVVTDLHRGSEALALGLRLARLVMRAHGAGIHHRLWAMSEIGLGAGDEGSEGRTAEEPDEQARAARESLDRAGIVGFGLATVAGSLADLAQKAGRTAVSPLVAAAVAAHERGSQVFPGAHAGNAAAADVVGLARHLLALMGSAAAGEKDGEAPAAGDPMAVAVETVLAPYVEEGANGADHAEGLVTALEELAALEKRRSADPDPVVQVAEPAPPPPKRTVEILEGSWPELKCVFRDWGPDGRSDPTLPQMLVIPAGHFTMGSPSTSPSTEPEPERFENEGPQHEVVISRPFALGRYAVTQAEWTAVMGDNPSHFKGDRNPVENVSWDDVKAFIAKLNAKLGLSEQAGYRLPSEAEWEYACRAGTTTPFWWGSTITTDQANYDGDYTYNSGKKGKYREKTVPVDQFAPNPWGLYQMHGNVREWCEDCWNDNYNGAPKNGTAWAAGNCSARVLRGGSGSSTRTGSVPPSAAGTPRASATMSVSASPGPSLMHLSIFPS